MYFVFKEVIKSYNQPNSISEIQSIYQTINQSIWQTNNKSVSKSNNRLFKQSSDQLVNQSYIQSQNQSAIYQFQHSVNLTFNQSVIQRKSISDDHLNQSHIQILNFHSFSWSFSYSNIQAKFNPTESFGKSIN